MRTCPSLALSLVVLAACGDVTRPALAPADRLLAVPSAATASAGATHTEGLFFARAACASDIGFDIYFGGPRVLVEHASPKGITRSLGTQDVHGWLVPVTALDYQQFTPVFGVLGGAEMFNLKPDKNGVLQTRIHEGTLVFTAVDGSYKVIARHVIRNVPGQSTGVNTWQCRIVG